MEISNFFCYIATLMEEIKIMDGLKGRTVLEIAEVKNLHEVYNVLKKYEKVSYDNKMDYPGYNIKHFAELGEGRSHESYVGTSFILIDFDGKSSTLDYMDAIDELIHKALKRVGYIEYSTFSHGKKGYRRRFILQLDKEVSIVNYPLAVETVAKMLKASLGKMFEKCNIPVTLDNKGLEIDDSFKSPHQYSLFVPRDFRYHEGARIAPDLGKVNGMDFDLQAETHSNESKISNDDYLAILDTSMAKTQDVSDYRKYSSLEISIQSDYQHNAITKETAENALIKLAQGNKTWERNNIERFNAQSKNPSKQVKNDKGLRAFSQAPTVGKSEMKAPVEEKKKRKSVTTLIDAKEGELQTYSEGLPRTEAITVQPVFKTDEDKNCKIVDLKVNMNLSNLCQELLNCGYLIYTENSLSKFYLFSEGYWQPKEARELIIAYRKKLLKDVMEGKVACWDGRLSPNPKYYVLTKMGFDNLDSIYSKLDTSLTKERAEMTLSTECMDKGKYLTVRESFFSKRNVYAQSFKNGTVYYNVHTGEHTFKAEHDPYDYIYQQIPRKFNDDLAQLGNNLGVQRWQEMLLTLFGDEETSRKFSAFVGKCAFPKEETAQVYGLMKSGGGSGKTSLAEFIMDMLGGGANCFKANFSSFFSSSDRFSRQLSVGRTFGFFDEIKVTPKVENVLKDETGSIMPRAIEQKGKDPVEVPPTYNLLLATNLSIRFTDTGESNRRRLKYFKFYQHYNNLSKEVSERFDFSNVLSKYKDEIMSYCVHMYFEELKLRAHNRATLGNYEAQARFLSSERMMKDIDILFNTMSVFDEFLNTMCVKYNTVVEFGETEKNLFDAFKYWFDKSGYDYGKEIGKALFADKIEEKATDVATTPGKKEQLNSYLEKIQQEQGFEYQVLYPKMREEYNRRTKQTKEVHDFARQKRYKGVFLNFYEWNGFVNEHDSDSEYDNPPRLENAVMIKVAKKQEYDSNDWNFYLENPKRIMEYPNDFVGLFYADKARTQLRFKEHESDDLQNGRVMISAKLVRLFQQLKLTQDDVDNYVKELVKYTNNGTLLNSFYNQLRFNVDDFAHRADSVEYVDNYFIKNSVMFNNISYEPSARNDDDDELPF